MPPIYGDLVLHQDHDSGDSNKDSDSQGIVIGFGKKWRIHPVGKCAQRHSQFVLAVKNLCKWIIEKDLETTIDAVFAYIRNEFQRMQWRRENTTMYCQVKKDNQKRAAIPASASLPKSP